MILNKLPQLEALWIVSCKKLSKGTKDKILGKLPKLQKLYITDKNEAAKRISVGNVETAVSL